MVEPGSALSGTDSTAASDMAVTTDMAATTMMAAKAAFNAFGISTELLRIRAGLAQPAGHAVHLGADSGRAIGPQCSPRRVINVD